jgi:hypothetical protein
MVAPINKIESPENSMPEDPAIQGHVQKLLGGKNAPPKVAPPLHSLLRECLEGKKVQDATINDFLSRNPSLARYDTAFNLLWLVLSHQGTPPQEATADQIADAIVQIFQYSPAQARNAYSAVLLIPGVGGGVRFHTLLQPYKRLWSTNVKKYGDFWDPYPLLLHLAETSFSVLQQNVSLLRTQLILVFRKLC